MGDISEHFDRSEFACRCGCGLNTVDVDLLGYLVAIRAHFDRPVRISSGCRCPEHNVAVGGAPTSQHLLGRAADISVDGTPPSVVQEYCDQLGVRGLGRYEAFTHIDSRSKKARF